MMLPYAMELWVETSLWRAFTGTLRMVCALSFVFSLFTMQTKGFHFSNAIAYGRAGYVATGRGFQMDTLSLVELYAKYAASHIHHGFEMLLYLALFWYVTLQTTAVVVISSVNVLHPHGSHSAHLPPTASFSAQSPLTVPCHSLLLPATWHLPWLLRCFSSSPL